MTLLTTARLYAESLSSWGRLAVACTRLVNAVMGHRPFGIDEQPKAT
jgi:hypothetical protein